MQYVRNLHAPNSGFPTMPADCLRIDSQRQKSVGQGGRSEGPHSPATTSGDPETADMAAFRHGKSDLVC